MMLYYTDYTANNQDIFTFTFTVQETRDDELIRSTYTVQ